MALKPQAPPEEGFISLLETDGVLAGKERESIQERLGLVWRLLTGEEESSGAFSLMRDVVKTSFDFFPEGEQGLVIALKKNGAAGVWAFILGLSKAEGSLAKSVRRLRELEQREGVDGVEKKVEEINKYLRFRLLEAAGYDNPDIPSISAATALCFAAGVTIGGAVQEDDWTWRDVSLYIDNSCGGQGGEVKTRLKQGLTRVSNSLGLSAEAVGRLRNTTQNIQ